MVRHSCPRACDGLEEAVRSADLVISAVTCSAAAEVARNSVQYLRSGQTYLDINSVSPETKREIAQILESSKAIFIEAAVMAPVSPQRLKVREYDERNKRYVTVRVRLYGLPSKSAVEKFLVEKYSVPMEPETNFEERFEGITIGKENEF